MNLLHKKPALLKAPVSLAVAAHVLRGKNRLGFARHLCGGLRSPGEAAEILDFTIALARRAGLDPETVYLGLEDKPNHTASLRDNGYNTIISMHPELLRCAPIDALKFIVAHEIAHIFTPWDKVRFAAAQGLPLALVLTADKLGAPGLRRLRQAGYIQMHRRIEAATDFRALGLFETVDEGMRCLTAAAKYTATCMTAPEVAPCLQLHPAPMARPRLAAGALKRAGIQWR